VTPTRLRSAVLLSAIVLGIGCGASSRAPADASSADAAPADAHTPADASTENDAGEPAFGSCDARRVLCDALPPTCGTGEAPSVSGACWGPCIPATECTCNTPEECPDVRGYSETCYPGRGMCGPVL